MGHSVRRQTGRRVGRWLGSAAVAAVAAVWVGRAQAAAADDAVVVVAADAEAPATQPGANDVARPGRSQMGRGEGGRGENGRGENGRGEAVRGEGGSGERRRGGGFGGGGFGGRGFGMGGGLGGVGGFGGAAFAGAIPSPDERATAMAFLSEHAPRYAKWITESAPPDNEFRIGMENTIARAYASYEAMKPTDPELYGVILKRIAAEDRIFGLRAQIQSAGDDARAKLVPDLRAQVTEWCDLSSKERHLRLARLERTVRQEKEKLAADDAARDQTIEARVNRIVSGGGRGLFPGGFGDGAGRRRTADPADTTADPQQGPR